MGITRNSLLTRGFVALGLCALLVAPGCADEEKTDVQVPAANDGGTELPAGVQDAIDDAAKQAEEAIGGARQDQVSQPNRIEDIRVDENEWDRPTCGIGQFSSPPSRSAAIAASPCSRRSDRAAARRSTSRTRIVRWVEPGLWPKGRRPSAMSRSTY